MMRRDFCLGLVGLGLFRRRRTSCPKRENSRWLEIGVWHDTGVKLVGEGVKAHPPPPVDGAEITGKNEYQNWTASPRHPKGGHRTWLFMRLIGTAEA